MRLFLFFLLALLVSSSLAVECDPAEGRMTAAGVNCDETKTQDECNKETNPCHHGGNCVTATSASNGDRVHICDCHHAVEGGIQYGGLHCEEPIRKEDECDKETNPCHHGGTCVTATSATSGDRVHICDCRHAVEEGLKYDGRYCEEPAPLAQSEAAEEAVSSSDSSSATTSAATATSTPLPAKSSMSKHTVIISFAVLAAFSVVVAIATVWAATTDARKRTPMFGGHVPTNGSIRESHMDYAFRDSLFDLSLESSGSVQSYFLAQSVQNNGSTTRMAAIKRSVSASRQFREVV